MSPSIHKHIGADKWTPSDNRGPTDVQKTSKINTFWTSQSIKSCKVSCKKLLIQSLDKPIHTLSQEKMSSEKSVQVSFNLNGCLKQLSNGAHHWIGEDLGYMLVPKKSLYPFFDSLYLLTKCGYENFWTFLPSIWYYYVP